MSTNVSIVVKCEHTQLVCPPTLCAWDNCLSRLADTHHHKGDPPAPARSGPDEVRKEEDKQPLIGYVSSQADPRLTPNWGPLLQRHNSSFSVIGCRYLPKSTMRPDNYQGLRCVTGQHRGRILAPRFRSRRFKLKQGLVNFVCTKSNWFFHRSGSIGI